MALISPHKTIRIDVGEGDPVELIVRQPTAAEHSAFLKSRLKERRNKVKSEVFEARQAFLDKILVDCRNVKIEDVDGTSIDLNRNAEITPGLRELYGLGEKDGWRDLIPPNWKSAAAMHFEEPEQVGDDEGSEKN